MKTLKLMTAGMLLFSGVMSAQVDTTKIDAEAPASKTVIVVQPDRKASAQEPDKDRDHFCRGIIGVNYMPTFSRFNLTSSSGGEISGSVVMNHGFGGVLGITGKHVGAQAEVIYNSYSQKYTDHSVERKVDLNYVNIPLLLVLSTDRSARVNLNIAAGPQIGLNVGANVQTTDNYNSVDVQQATVAVKKGDLGLAYGAGLEIALDPAKCIRLGAGFRGVYGLIDIRDNSKTMVGNNYMVLDRTNIVTYAGYLGLGFFF